MNKKLKMISIVAIIFAILLSLTSSCFAVQPQNLITSENAKSYYDLAKKYADDNNIAIVDYLICSDGYVYLFKEGYSCFTNGDYISANKVLIFEFKTSPEDVSNLKPIIDGGGSSYTSNSKIIFSSFDVKNASGDKVVFPKTPVEGNLVLAPIVEVAPLEGTTKEIVEIFPIVLTILVGLIGLRKGLALLSQTLHKA